MRQQQGVALVRAPGLLHGSAQGARGEAHVVIHDQHPGRAQVLKGQVHHGIPALCHAIHWPGRARRRDSPHAPNVELPRLCQQRHLIQHALQLGHQGRAVAQQQHLHAALQGVQRGQQAGAAPGRGGDGQHGDVGGQRGVQRVPRGRHLPGGQRDQEHQQRQGAGQARVEEGQGGQGPRPPARARARAAAAAGGGGGAASAGRREAGAWRGARASGSRSSSGRRKAAQGGDAGEARGGRGKGQEGQPQLGKGQGAGGQALALAVVVRVAQGQRSVALAMRRAGRGLRGGRKVTPRGDAGKGGWRVHGPIQRLPRAGRRRRARARVQGARATHCRLSLLGGRWQHQLAARKLG